MKSASQVKQAVDLRNESSVPKVTIASKETPKSCSIMQTGDTGLYHQNAMYNSAKNQ